jgi:CubicO group peptidase (beta-lactamase class C family)
MKTRVIQNHPEELPKGAAGVVATDVAKPRPSNGRAGGLRGWSSTHRRLTLVGALVLLAVVIGVIALATKSNSVATAPITPATEGGSPDYAAIDRYVRNEMDAQRIPGLALGIVHEGRIVHLRGFGKADESGRAVTPQTLFFNGSTTKSFTALAIMQLREAGKLELDSPVQRYLPWWRVADAQASARITVRQLLYQVSGLSKATGNEHATTTDNRASALQDQVRELRSAKLAGTVGETWQYSNANYNTLGMIVQAVSGQPYETYVRKHILVPLGMRDSVMSEAAAEQHGLVTGYRYWFGFPFAVGQPFNRGNLPAGGLISNVQDMSHYLTAQVNGGRYGKKTILSPAGMAELHRAGVPTGHEDVDYAMGMEVRTTNGIRTIAHDGSSFNAHANLVLIPEGKWGIILMENAENSPDEFFGSRRMSGIADGVTSMVKGKQPASTGTSATVWIVFGIVFAIIALQFAGITRSVRRFRRRPPKGFPRTALAIGVPLALSLLWAFIVLIGIPQKVGAPLSALLMGMPDLGYLLLISVVVGLTWALAKTVWAALTLRPRPAA